MSITIDSRKLHFYILLVVLLCLNTPLTAEDELQQSKQSRKLKVFILAGQSNMEGRADGNKLTTKDLDRLKNLQGRVQLAFNGEPVRPLGVTQPSTEIGKIYKRDSIFGPELFFGITLGEIWADDHFLLIKRTEGGTSLHGCWNPVWHKDKAKQVGEENAPKLYSDLISYIKQILADNPRNDYEICAILWVQGESDSRNEMAAKQYGANLKNLITHVRNDLETPDLPFLLFQVGSGKVIKGMQQAEREIPNVTLIPQSHERTSQDYYEKMDNGHYNYAGMKKLGSRFAENYLRHAEHP